MFDEDAFRAEFSVIERDVLVFTQKHFTASCVAMKDDYVRWRTTNEFQTAKAADKARRIASLKTDALIIKRKLEILQELINDKPEPPRQQEKPKERTLSSVTSSGKKRKAKKQPGAAFIDDEAECDKSDDEGDETDEETLEDRKFIDDRDVIDEGEDSDEEESNEWDESSVIEPVRSPKQSTTSSSSSSSSAEQDSAEKLAGLVEKIEGRPIGDYLQVVLDTVFDDTPSDETIHYARDDALYKQASSLLFGNVKRLTYYQREKNFAGETEFSYCGIGYDYTHMGGSFTQVRMYEFGVPGVKEHLYYVTFCKVAHGEVVSQGSVPDSRLRRLSADSTDKGSVAFLNSSRLTQFQPATRGTRLVTPPPLTQVLDAHFLAVMISHLQMCEHDVCKQIDRIVTKAERQAAERGTRKSIHAAGPVKKEKKAEDMLDVLWKSQEREDEENKKSSSASVPSDKASRSVAPKKKKQKFIQTTIAPSGVGKPRVA